MIERPPGGFMYNLDEEKEALIKTLSEKYSLNIITMEEYERILEYINNIETRKEVNIIEKIIAEYVVNTSELAPAQKNEASPSGPKEKHLSMFSWRSTTIKPLNGDAGKFTCCFGADRIILEDLPKGRTVLHVNTIFGLTEIIAGRGIKIINKTIPVFSGVFTPGETNGAAEESPELYITGKAVFGNITIKTMDELKQEKEFGEKYAAIIRQNILDKISEKK
jgi:hypothetical protein